MTRYNLLTGMYEVKHQENGYIIIPEMLRRSNSLEGKSLRFVHELVKKGRVRAYLVPEEDDAYKIQILNRLIEIIDDTKLSKYYQKALNYYTALNVSKVSKSGETRIIGNKESLDIKLDPTLIVLGDIKSILLYSKKKGVKEYDLRLKLRDSVDPIIYLPGFNSDNSKKTEIAESQIIGNGKLELPDSVCDDYIAQALAYVCPIPSMNQVDILIYHSGEIGAIARTFRSRRQYLADLRDAFSCYNPVKINTDNEIRIKDQLEKADIEGKVKMEVMGNRIILSRR